MLKKQILNRNPRKEGIAFERKLNADGSYWKPEQYPKTSWVAATGPPFDPSNLTGFSCELSYSSDESFDSNYKLFKNQSGEVFARYVGTNCRNGPPLRKIWVPKSCLENLQVNVLMTSPLKNLNPRSNSSGGPKSSRGSKSSSGQNYARPVLMLLTCRETTRNMIMSATPQIIMFINHQTSSLHTHMSTLTPLLLREVH